MDNPVQYMPASQRSHDLVWDRVTGHCLSLDEFMDGRDYGEILRDGRLAAELELLEGTPRYQCPHCPDSIGVRSKAIRARTEFRFYFDHGTARYRDTCTGRKGYSSKAILARKFRLHKESALHRAFKQWGKRQPGR